MNETRVTQAVRDLRAALGETQQAFAHRLGTAIRTVARWEKTRPPSGASLAQLERVAAEKGFADLAGVFRAALAAELGTWDTSGFESVYAEPRTDAERLWVTAVLAVLRNAQYAEDRARLIPILHEPAQACIKVLERARLGHRLRAEAVRLLDRGLEPAAVAKALEVSENEIRQVAMVERMVKVAQEGIQWANEQRRETK